MRFRSLPSGRGSLSSDVGKVKKSKSRKVEKSKSRKVEKSTGHIRRVPCLPRSGSMRWHAEDSTRRWADQLGCSQAPGATAKRSAAVQARTSSNTQTASPHQSPERERAGHERVAGRTAKRTPSPAHPSPKRKRRVRRTNGECRTPNPEFAIRYSTFDIPYSPRVPGGTLWRVEQTTPS